MSSSKSQQYQQNTVYSAPVQTPGYQGLRDFEPDNDLLAPQLNYQYAVAGRDLNNSIDSVYSGVTNPYDRQRMKTQANAQLQQQRGAALAQGAYDLNRIKLAQREALANLDRPVQTQSYGYGPQQGSNGMVAAGISGGAGVLAAAMPAIIAA